MSNDSQVLTLRTLLGDYPNTLALKKGGIRSLVVKEPLRQSNPAVVKEIFHAVHESKQAASPPSGLNAIQFGVEKIQRSLELIIEYSVQQKLIPRRFKVEDLFDEVTGALA